jgi:hypothetical protein
MVTISQFNHTSVCGILIKLVKEKVYLHVRMNRKMDSALKLSIRII